MKTIMVRDEVYEALLKLKKPNESFSDVILRLINERRDKTISALKKISGLLSKEEYEKVKSIIYSERKKFNLREYDI